MPAKSQDDSRSNSPFSSNPSMKPSSSTSKSVSTVDSSVTRLLMSTKQLLQRLTQWSKGQANERNVSDAYVQLGNDFKLVSKHFSHSGLDVTDLGDVPMNLRKVLEVALRETPSEAVLDRYLPSIREIIVSLLDKLKVKQALMRNLKQQVGSRSLPVTPTGQARASSATFPESFEDAKDNGTHIEVRSPAAVSTPLRRSSGSSQQMGESSRALDRLKKGDTLQRRASKRFSAYHMAKLAHHAVSDAPNMTPVPVPGLAVGVENLSPQGTDQASAKQLKDELAATTQRVTGISAEKTPTFGTIQLLLRIGNKTKKCSASQPINFNTLRLLFLEKFTYTPGETAFPEIYIQEPGDQVPYELEEVQLPRIKNGSLLELQVPTEPNVGGNDLLNLAEEFSKLKSELLVQQQAFFKSFRTTDTGIAVMPDRNGGKLAEESTSRSNSFKNPNFKGLKHDLSVLKQLHTNNSEDLHSNIAILSQKLERFRSLSFHASTSANRVYMEKAHSKLSEVSDELLGKVDDLQDIIEAMRKDVAVRGSKPSKKKIEAVSLEITGADDALRTMNSYIETEKPNWKRIWESELEKVCEEQQFLKLQEDLAFDFGEDLRKAIETFDLVKMCCEEQEKNPKRARGKPLLPIPKPGTFNQVREAVLLEVQSLAPDHDSRVEAIEKAERLRLRERGFGETTDFEDELGSFVGKGSFKKAGGIAEIEKARKQKDQENIKASFQTASIR
ncbi:LAMI_0D05688g1_1 [Lachancea mirantina]|uniref:LAMI_0D05688g1_1 n=1 Tax=Lachancea mirantina TaxID=1230905 RepID=A0A1G4JB77_9SACH|nr:LAMI_0D05688g1_1 [Lachancea mirantina]